MLVHEERHPKPPLQSDQQLHACRRASWRPPLQWRSTCKRASQTTPTSIATSWRRRWRTCAAAQSARTAWRRACPRWPRLRRQLSPADAQQCSWQRSSAAGAVCRSCQACDAAHSVRRLCRAWPAPRAALAVPSCRYRWQRLLRTAAGSKVRWVQTPNDVRRVLQPHGHALRGEHEDMCHTEIVKCLRLWPGMIDVLGPAKAHTAVFGGQQELTRPDFCHRSMRKRTDLQSEQSRQRAACALVSGSCNTQQAAPQWLIKCVVFISVPTHGVYQN